MNMYLCEIFRVYLLDSRRGHHVLVRKTCVFYVVACDYLEIQCLRGTFYRHAWITGSRLVQKKMENNTWCVGFSYGNAW